MTLKWDEFIAQVGQDNAISLTALPIEDDELYPLVKKTIKVVKDFNKKLGRMSFFSRKMFGNEEK